MWSEKNDVLRRIAIDSFWRIHDGPSIAAVEDKIRKATGRSFERREHGDKHLRGNTR